MSNSISFEDPKVIPMTAETSNPRRCSIIREFALNTSTHGLPGIARSQSKYNRIFWTISFLIFAAVMIFFVSQSIQDYFQYSTQTSVSIIVERSQIFPAVTFCNYAFARFDRIIGPLLNYTSALNLTNTNNISITSFTAQEASMLGNFLLEKLNAHEPVIDYLFALNTMLLNCSYNDEVCGVNDFISFVSSVYGLCYTFNAKRKDLNSSNIRSTNDYGGSGKLQLRLYVNSHLYVPYVTQGLFQ
jgi:hypothetical protein